MLYAGLMFTPDGISVLEYNVRFGDPECQPLLMRLKSDLVETMLACIEGRLNTHRLEVADDTAVCVVMAAKGYPGPYPKGMEISGIDDAEALGAVKIFQAGTRLRDGRVLSSGGRVLGVTALGPDLAAAQRLAYRAADTVGFPDSYMRRDIAAKGIARLAKG